MSLWFVYDDTTYYPSAGLIEAATAEQAAKDFGVSRDYGGVVFPASSVAYVAGIEHDWNSLHRLRVLCETAHGNRSREAHESVD